MDCMEREGNADCLCEQKEEENSKVIIDENLKKRVEDIIERLAIRGIASNNKEIAEQMGIGYSTFNQAKRGSVNHATRNFFKKVYTTWPEEFCRDWCMLGIGPMYPKDLPAKSRYATGTRLVKTDEEEEQPNASDVRDKNSFQHPAVNSMEGAMSENTVVLGALIARNEKMSADIRALSEQVLQLSESIRNLQDLLKDQHTV